jgi:hypothetical protein
VETGWAVSRQLSLAGSSPGERGPASEADLRDGCPGPGTGMLETRRPPWEPFENQNGDRQHQEDDRHRKRHVLTVSSVGTCEASWNWRVLINT